MVMPSLTIQDRTTQFSDINPFSTMKTLDIQIVQYIAELL